MEGAKSVKLFGEAIEVEAEIVSLEGVSGHADQAGLLRWLDAFETPIERIFVVHGESDVCDSFAALLAKRYNVPVTAPDYGRGLRPFDQHHARTGRSSARIHETRRKPESVYTGVFGRLYAAGKRLMAVIEHNRGGAQQGPRQICRPGQFPLRQVGQISARPFGIPAMGTGGSTTLPVCPD